jgi:hypothetical protein
MGNRQHIRPHWKEIAMKAFMRSIPTALVAAFFIVGAANAQAPSGSTGSCKDGTFTTASSKRGACSGHGGVKDWFADQKAAPSGGASTAQTPSAQNSAPARNPSVATAPSAQAEDTGKARATTAPGGGQGKVWVNTSSKVYHCPGDQWYGKTEKGSYMTESSAKAQGDRPAYNKTCGS